MAVRRLARLEFGTFGKLTLANGFECATCEPPWLNNRPWVSCVSSGVYPVSRAKFRDCYEALLLHNVPGRDGIFIHVANWPSQLSGCIAPGRRIETIQGELGVAHSRTTFADLMRAFERLEDQGPVELVVRWQVIP